MVESRLKLESEVQQLLSLIDDNQNFVLSGGAGSGKTYSLVQLMNQVKAENSKYKIACITYTNAAVKEIESRIDNKNVKVSTIHEFLWSSIKSFQKELKEVIINLVNDESEKRLQISNGMVNKDYYKSKTIEYKEYTRLNEGIISHDELLIVANRMFDKYKKLCDIVKDKYNLILIDEYQDTDEVVVQIFLDHLGKSAKNNVIGFFGDSMQAIYETGIGDLNYYINRNDLEEVVKNQNRRNPRLVYELANKLRTDSIIQEPSKDDDAPNMKDGKVKVGSVSFYFSRTEDKLDELKENLNWEKEDSTFKELSLTHNLIASKAGFSELMNIYDNDKILSYKNRVLKYMKTNNIDIEFLDLTFKQCIDKLIDEVTIESELKKILPTTAMKKFIDENDELYKRALSYEFNDFRNIYLNKDLLIEGKKSENDTNLNRDALIAHLFKIQSYISLYETGKYNEFLRKTEFKVENISKKKRIQKIINDLKNMSEKTIEEVIVYAHSTRFCKIDDRLSDFIGKKNYVYYRVSKIQFKEFQNLYNYLEGYTPFSTQHKIKGNEYDNVLVVLDNGNWRNYNFEYLLDESIQESLTVAQKANFPKILKRTQKIFYVCCTRAKEKLVVYYRNPSDAELEKVQEWFGMDNVYEI